MKKSAYTRPNKPLSIPASRREVQSFASAPTSPQPIIIDRSTQCFVTPTWVAQRAIEYAEAGHGKRWLEPSAGTGNLINAMLDEGIPQQSITAIEKHHALVTTLQTRFNGLTVHQTCFIAWATETLERYDRILMTPPYAGKEAYRHIEAATRLLNSDGILIAIVPITLKHTGDDLETLPNNTFSGTTVKTKIIRITSRVCG